MDKLIAVEKTKSFVKNMMNKEPGHDWFHIERVLNLSKMLAQREGADMFVVEMAALLHDIDDWKFSKDSAKTLEWLNSLNIDREDIDKIMNIVEHISFKGVSHDDKMKSIEGMVVQDADRLDALGAIGISRVFSFAGHANNTIHDPNEKPRLDMSTDEYKKNKSTAINHFYEKVLLLKERMNTRTGKELAEERHEFIEAYLDRFLKEWSGSV